MLVKVSSDSLLFADLVPQGQFQSTDAAVREVLTLTEDADDLDDFVGGAFAVEGHPSFVMKHYRGEPSGLYTLFFDQDVPPERALSFAWHLLDELGLEGRSIVWARATHDEDSYAPRNRKAV